MRTKKKLGVYIHIPFCKQKCSYCDFYSIPINDDKVSQYVKEISKHIKEYAMVSKNYTVDTIYIGGGTPSAIGYKQLVEIIKNVYKNFEVSKDCEITIELNPESTDVKLLKALKKAGVSRLSFGVQTSNDELIDQTMEQLETDLINFLALDVDHISTYALKVEPNTKLFSQSPKELSEDLVADMYDKVCKVLGESGYEHYEISNFCRNNKRSRHNMKYWKLDEYIGIGPSAHSLFSNARFGYVRDLEDYMLNQTIAEREEDAPFETRFGEYIMLKLRTIDGIDVDEFYRLFTMDFSDYMPKCKIFIENGYAKYEKGVFSLTEKGFFISNYIINEILN